MTEKISVLGLILSFPPYLSSALGGLPMRRLVFNQIPSPPHFRFKGESPLSVTKDGGQSPDKEGRKSLCII